MLGWMKTMAVIMATALALAPWGGPGEVRAETATPPGAGARQEFPANPLGIQAKAALLMDAFSGQVLYAFHENDRMEPASLAKIMTFDLILEAVEKGVLGMDTKVPVSERAWRLALDNSLSNMFIEVGQQVKVRDLLNGLMVSSGNDAALALAEYRGGSEEGFVAMMNDRARQLGMKDTVFTNSHGLSDPNQHTTARDMAVLARHIVLQHPEAFEITSRKDFTYGRIRQANWNKLLFKDPRVNGLKTGHLPEVGYHLVATARDRGMSLIAVVLGTAGEEERASEAEKLLNYGFNNFSTVEVRWQDKVASSLPVYKGRERRVALVTAAPVVVTVPREAERSVTVEGTTVGRAVAPVKKGEHLGRISVKAGGREVAGFDLLAAADVPRGGLLRVIWDSLRLFFGRLIGR